MPRICVPITATTVEDVLRDIEVASKLADLIELRFDFIPTVDVQGVKRLIAAKRVPIIATCRKKDEGGKWERSETERAEILRAAIANGAEHVDIELSMDARLRDELIREAKAKGTDVIVSFHDFSGTPEYDKLAGVVDAELAAGADIAKVACMGNAIEDNIRMLHVIEYAKKKNVKIIALIMGKYGKPARVMSPFFGAYLTFASLNKGKESAPGQMPIEKMKQLYSLLS